MTALPDYIQAGIQCGIVSQTDDGRFDIEERRLERISDIARIVDKLQPIRISAEDSTINQQAFILGSVLNATSTVAKDLWRKLREALGVGFGQKSPLSLWSTPVFQTIAREIDFIYIGDRDTKVISSDSIIGQYKSLRKHRTVSFIEFAKTVEQLVSSDTLETYGDFGAEWESTLDVFRRERVKTLMLQTVETVRKNMNADIKIEQSLEFMGERVSETLGMIRGTIGSQGQWVDLRAAIYNAQPNGEPSWHERILKAERVPRPATTGIPALDIDIDGGVAWPTKREVGGRVHTIAARTGVGKTVMGVHIATALHEQGMEVAYVSAELSMQQIQARLYSGVSRKTINERHHWTRAIEHKGYVTAQELFHINPQDKVQIATILDLIDISVTHPEEGTGGRIMIEAPFGATADTVVEILRSMKSRNPKMRAAIIDHFHALSKHGGAPNNEQSMLSERAYKILSVAKELDLDIFVLAQCNQVGLKESRSDLSGTEKEPELDWIRGTDALGHISHAVWICRKPKQKEGEDMGNFLEVWHSKKRTGQYVWSEGESAEMFQVRGEIRKSIIKFDYPTSWLESDDTLDQEPAAKALRSSYR